MIYFIIQGLNPDGQQSSIQEGDLPKNFAISKGKNIYFIDGQDELYTFILANFSPDTMTLSLSSKSLPVTISDKIESLLIPEKFKRFHMIDYEKMK